MRQLLTALSGSVLLIGFLLAVLLGWSLFWGWLLMLALPFTLFEGTLLIMIATMFVTYSIANASEMQPVEDWEEEEDITDYYMLPFNQFMGSKQDYNWGNWVRYNLANEVDYVYREFLEDDNLSEEARESMAIHMADAAIEVLKRKSFLPPNGITTNQLNRQLNKMNVQLEHERYLDLALNRINEVITFPYIEIVIRQKKWKQRYPAVLLDEDFTPI